MFRPSSISLQLLVVTTCLLGGCEKREAAPAAERGSPSSTKSSFRSSDGKSRAGVDRRERTDIQDVLEAIRTISQLDPSEKSGLGTGRNHEILTRAEEAIKEADPAEFDAIMKELGQPEGFVNLRALAIFHLAAGRDLVRAGEISLKMFPSGEDRRGVLGSLVNRTYPSAPDALDFWRSLPAEERSEVAEYAFKHAAADMGTQGLAKWKEKGYRLSEEETVHMMKTMAGNHINALPILPPIDGSSDDVPSEYPDLIEAIRPLEKEGVLSKGAADELILQAALSDEGSDFIGMPATQAVVGEMKKDGFDSLYRRIAAERPHRFFTADGIHDLPEGKTTVAWTAWLGADPAAAREWFGEHGPELPPSERDLIHAGFASHALGEGNAEAAREWGSQIADPEVRAGVLSGLPKTTD